MEPMGPEIDAPEEENMSSFGTNGQGFAEDEEDIEITHENLLEQLRKERTEEADEETLIPVPGYHRVPLLVKYRMLDGNEIQKIGRKSRKIRDDWTRNFTTAIDTMIAAAIGVYVEFDGEVQPLTVNGQEVMGFTPDLAKALNLEGADTARKVVIGTFKNKDLHIATHATRLNRWFTGTNSTLDEEFLGE
jgi:hypothetical protein